MKRQKWPYDQRLRELVRAFLKMARSVQRPYAIGGALAMRVHGYARETSDLDAFLLQEDRLQWLRAAKAAGLTVDRVFGNIHLIAFMPKHGDPRIRIDLLFPAAEPELSAIEHPVEGDIGGISVHVFPVELLAISKFISDRPEDQRDFCVMFQLGLFEPETIRAILGVIKPDRMREYDKAVRTLSRPTRNIKRKM